MFQTIQATLVGWSTFREVCRWYSRPKLPWWTVRCQGSFSMVQMTQTTLVERSAVREFVDSSDDPSYPGGTVRCQGGLAADDADGREVLWLRCWAWSVGVVPHVYAQHENCGGEAQHGYQQKYCSDHLQSITSLVLYNLLLCKINFSLQCY